MRNFKKTVFLILIISSTFTFVAQDLADNYIINPIENNSNKISSSAIIPLIENEKFTYKSHGKEVLVIFNETEHLELFNNKKYYIKSKVLWSSKNECSLTIISSDLPHFPFKNGTKLGMKIIKIKGQLVYYESTLGGRTWSGKMRKL